MNDSKNVVCRKERNYYIDTIKGIAILSVILIHTAFHSGVEYVPLWFANLTLLFEVPMFFFLTGWSYSYTKSKKRYVQKLFITQIKYMIFMVFIFIGIKLSVFYGFYRNPANIVDLIGWFFHNYTSTVPFHSVLGSLWFFKVYFIVAIIGMIIHPKVKKYICAICLIFVVITTFFFPEVGKITIGIELNFLAFYLFFYLLGYNMREKSLSNNQFIILNIITMILIIGIKRFTNIDVANILQNKFDVNFVFLLWSMYGVYIVLFLKSFFVNCKENIIAKIGQNSIYIYLAQGIGSSVLYYLIPYIHLEWYIKLPIMLIINLTISMLIAIALGKMLNPVEKWLKNVFQSIDLKKK